MASTQTTEILRSTVRTTAIRLVSLDGSSSPGPTPARSSWAEPPQRQSPLKVGYSWKNLFGLQQSGQLKVVLQAPGKNTSLLAAMRPAALCCVHHATRYVWLSHFSLDFDYQASRSTSPYVDTAGHEPSLITFGSSGRGQKGGYIEFGPDETRGRLEIIVQSGSRTVAGGVISVEELWQVSMSTHQNLTLRVYLFELIQLYLVYCNLTILVVNHQIAVSCRPDTICIQAFSTE